MSRYAIELRTVYGKQVWCVLDTSCMVVRTIARCDSREHAALVCDALNSSINAGGALERMTAQNV